MLKQWKGALAASVLGGLCVVMSGCAEKQGEMNMDAMTPPARPAELDRLDAMVGNWEGTFEMKMAGSDQVMKGKGTSTIGWEAGKWILVERGEYTMGDKGDKMQMLGLWMYDAESKSYSTFWGDNGGGLEHGRATYDEATHTWNVKSSGDSPMFGKSRSEATVKMVDKNTMEWKGTVWNSWKTKKLSEMTGTSKRK